MAKDVCQCPNCDYSLGDMVEEYDDQDVLPKKQKVFVCPSCNQQATFRDLYPRVLAFCLVAIVIFISVDIYCLIKDGKCSPYAGYIKTAHTIVAFSFMLLVLSNKWVPRLKVYRK